MGWQWGQGPWKRLPYIQISDVLFYKPIPIIPKSYYDELFSANNVISLSFKNLTMAESVFEFEPKNIVDYSIDLNDCITTVELSIQNIK